MEDLVVFCADVGSVKAGNFGWAFTYPAAGWPVAEFGGHEPTGLRRSRSR